MGTVAFDISPLKSGHLLRGVGFYTKKLFLNFQKNREAIKKEGIEIIFFENGKIPKEADLVHYPFFDPFFLTLPFLKDKKTIVTVHDLIPLIFPEKFPRGIRGEVKWQIQRLALKNTAGIITDSENSKKDIMKIIGYPKERIYRVYLAPDEKFRGLEDEEWQIEVRSKYNLPENFILYVGDVNYNKNVLGLIRAFRNLKSQISNVKTKSQILNLKLVLVGGAFVNNELVETKEINNLIKDLDLESGIITPGFVNDDDLVKIYNLASIYVQPSFYEGFGLPVLEAMACGCPVVSSNKSSLPEIGGEAVYYVEPNDEKGVTNGILKVLNNTILKQKLIEKGLTQVKKFSWQKTMYETLEIYKKLLQ